MNGTFRASTLCAALLAVACGRPYEHDPVEISSRYEMKWKDECSAWLRSPKTGYLYCSSPPFTVQGKMPVTAAPAGAAGGDAPAKDGPTDQAALVANGEKVYKQVCAACHQANGLGVPGAFPPLAGAGSFSGDPQNHARIIVKGLSGEITVNGVKFNGAMPPQGSLTDYEIASVATYERNSWGNADGVVLPADVAAVR